MKKLAIFCFALQFFLVADVAVLGAESGKIHKGTKGSNLIKPSASVKDKSPEPLPDPGKLASDLNKALQDYKFQADDLNWAAVVKALKQQLALSNQADPAALTKANGALADLGPKVIPAGGARIWLFSKSADHELALVVWTETKIRTVAVGRRRHKVVHETHSKVAELQLPADVILKDCRTIDIAEPADTGVHRVRYLICIGKRKATDNIWLDAYSATADGWRQCSELFAAVPPYLTSNLSGNAAFNGLDLVVTVAPGSSGSMPEPSSATYKLVLSLVHGKYALEGAAENDTPYNAAFQFVQAIEAGKTNLAAAWLADPNLISIPKYVGLPMQSQPSKQRLINMDSPHPGTFRFRLITFEKYDLILDVAKSKAQWAVKSIFIVASDPLLQKITRGMPSSASRPNSGVPGGMEADSKVSRH